MEEVDQIIIHTLKSIGCEIEEDVVSLLQFSTELIVEAAATCLQIINNEVDIPHKLPPSMSARFRVGTKLATVIQGLGYRGEVGYQTFLYSSEVDIRRVFMFLLEKLPKEAAGHEGEQLGASALLQRAIASEMTTHLAAPWTPPFCKTHGICWRGKPASWHREGCKDVQNFHSCPLRVPHGLHDLTKTVPKELKSYYRNVLPYVHCQPKHHHEVAASVLEMNAKRLTAQQEWETEWNQQGLVSRLTPQEYRSRKQQRIKKRVAEQLKQSCQEARSAGPQDLKEVIDALTEKSSARTKGSRFTHTEQLQFAKEDENSSSINTGDSSRRDTEEEQRARRDAEMEQLRTELEQETKKLEEMQLGIRKYTSSTQQMEERMEGLTKSTQEKKEAYKVKKTTMDLLPDADNNIAKLQALVDNSSQRLASLADQWEKHRAPLIEEFNRLKELNDTQETETHRILEEIKVLRETMKAVADDTRAKEQLHKQLVTEYERMAKDVNRSAYTRKILEIVNNIKKQKDEIDKVLIDTRAVQKEINRLSGKLDRTFTVTDELIFRDAKRDEAVKKSYKYLAALHDNCNQLISTVEDTGVIIREIRDFEDQIEQESKKNSESNSEKLSADLQQIKKENSALMSKLKKQTQS